MNAQGEDVVAGVRTPMHIDAIKETMPEIYDQLLGTLTNLKTTTEM